MAFKLSYATLRWREPDLEPALAALKEAGWQGWEGRLPLDWLGTPARVRRVCQNTEMPLVVYTAQGSPDQRDRENVERNKRRMEFAAEVGADCFMFMNGRKPEGRPVTDDDLKAAAEGAEAWAEYAASLGLELSYHIHTNLLVDSVEDWKTYMSYLDKAKLCIDVSHAQLWGYDPADSIRDFRNQLNYVHLQDYSSTSRRPDGYYLPVWVDVGQGEQVDFRAVRDALQEIGFQRWVTACPGEPLPGDDPLREAQRSKRMVEYLRGIGY
ncbi:MAG TPA: sugar phosphate isomerase/epimerase [Caldilineaceae bacterium]|nr:sugar phosphate isomerase/epimerase [Caldilineaceae bacterium]